MRPSCRRHGVCAGTHPQSLCQSAQPCAAVRFACAAFCSLVFGDKGFQDREAVLRSIFAEKVIAVSGNATAVEIARVRIDRDPTLPTQANPAEELSLESGLIQLPRPSKRFEDGRHAAGFACRLRLGGWPSGGDVVALYHALWVLGSVKMREGIPTRAIVHEGPARNTVCVMQREFALYMCSL